MEHELSLCSISPKPMSHVAVEAQAAWHTSPSQKSNCQKPALQCRQAIVNVKLEKVCEVFRQQLLKLNGSPPVLILMVRDVKPYAPQRRQHKPITASAFGDATASFVLLVRLICSIYVIHVDASHLFHMLVLDRKLLSTYHSSQVRPTCSACFRILLWEN